MLAWEKVEEIRRLLADEAWSHRRIAVALGVGRSTVGRIARGEYAPASTDPEEDEEERELFAPPSGPHRRCPRCGAKVQLPCLACRVRLWDMVERLAKGS